MTVLLPRLAYHEAAPRPANEPRWTRHEGGLAMLAGYSSALDFDSDALIRAERLKSVPSPWARALLFEQALSSETHPAHQQLVAEWRGLLGCLALSEYMRLRVVVSPVDLGEAVGAAGLLRTLAPGDDADDDSTDRQRLWWRLGLVWMQEDGNQQLLGASSPRTLVFTGIRPVKVSIPFQRDGRLDDPTRHFLEYEDARSLTLLLEWIDLVCERLRRQADDLRQFLGFQPAAANPISRAELCLRLLGQWRDDTNRAVEALGSTRPDAMSDGLGQPHFTIFNSQEAVGRVLRTLCPVKPREGAESNDMCIRNVTPPKVLDPGRTGVIFSEGHPYTGRINLPRGFSRRVESGRFEIPASGAQLGNDPAELGALFQERLIKVSGANDPARTLDANGAHYLYPFDSALLEHLTPEQVARWCHAEDDPGGVTVRLEIPLRRSGLELRFERRYELSESVRDYQTPQLLVWPNFRARGWQHHYYYRRQVARERNLEIEPIFPQRVVEGYQSDDGTFAWGRVNAPIQAWLCSADSTRGLLLAALPADDAPDPDAIWDVSIDFGSTHTRVFHAKSGVGGEREAEALALVPRAVPLLGGAREINFFAAPSDDMGSMVEPRSLVVFPLGRLPHVGYEHKRWLPSDGVIYWGSLLGATVPKGLRASLKWHERGEDERAFQSYISQLYLSIAAEAAAAGARIASVSTAYPSAFPERLRRTHATNWSQLAQFGVTVHPPARESTALALYLQRKHNAPAVANLLAIDVGGSTSDLTVWSGGGRSSGDSVRFAGDVLSRLVATDAAARNAISVAAGRQPIRRELKWDSDGAVNALLFNALLRVVASKSGGSTRDLAGLLDDGPGSPGERVIAHAAYMYATVSYLLGLMTRQARVALDQYYIYFAGHGSEFLGWLETFGEGASTALPCQFFLAGLGVSPGERKVDVTLSKEDVKEEVGRGLLHGAAQEDERADRERITFVGESGFADQNGELGWDAALSGDGLANIAQPELARPLAELPILSAFIAAFDLSDVTRTVARAIGLRDDQLNNRLRDRIHTKLFGEESSWAKVRSGGLYKADTMLEPFFVTEAKALLEHVTGNPSLFS